MSEIDVDRLAEGIAERLAAKLDDRPLLRMVEAAARLSVSRRTLDGLVKRGELRTVRVAGGAVRVETAEIDRYITARRSLDASTRDV